MKRFLPLLMLTGLIFCQDLVLPRSNGNKVIQKGQWLHRIGRSVNDNGRATILDTISLFTPPDSASNYNGILEVMMNNGFSSVITEFQLLRQGIIKELHVMNATGGPANVIVWGPSRLYEQDSNDSTTWSQVCRQFPADDVDGDCGNNTNIQNLLTDSVSVSFNTSIPNNHFNDQGDWDPWGAEVGTGWNIVDFEAELGSGISVDVGIDDNDLYLPEDSIYVWVGYTSTSGIANENFASVYTDQGTTGQRRNVFVQNFSQRVCTS